MLSVLTFVGECALIFADVGRRLFSRPFEGAEFARQLGFVGLGSIPIVALTTFFSGSVLALYSTEILVRYGATSLAGGAVGLAVTREVAPVLAGIMVAARCGSAMAAQIGTMKVTEQIDALTMLNVHPTRYLVIPRVLAGVLGVPFLCLVGSYAGVIGGVLVAGAGGVPQASFMRSLQQFVNPWDIQAAMIKALFFGLILTLVACQQGMRTENGAVGVGRSTTSTVVISMVLIYATNFLLSAILY